MQRAAQTFHLPTADGWRTIAAGDELADDDPAVEAAPQYFVTAEPRPAGSDPSPVPAKRRTQSGATAKKVITK
ncbi:hypothetical protein ACIBI9_04165 [Nonomuraea sp. NPDC050451]|uniref:hypothetical protein n=1 Tax=Nonomuraea sp. NPDC050451 TaxID=3364364 RepID=UPI0037A97A50